MNKTTRSILTAATFAATFAVLGTSIASAQYQIDRSGANDANNRIGSGGRNAANVRPNPWDLNNNIVYGNVTGGKQFRGEINTRDPFEFRGSTADQQIDAFVRDSSGVSTDGFTTYNSQRTREYYGGSRAVAPPPDFSRIPGTGGYVPNRPPTWTRVDPRRQSLSDQTQTVMRPDQFNMPGQVDSTFAPNALAVPPLMQAQQLNQSSLSDYTQLNRDLESQLSPEMLQQLRGELQGQRVNDQSSPAQRPGMQTKPQEPGTNPDAAPAGEIRQTPVDDRLASPIATEPLSDAVNPAGVQEPGLRTSFPGQNAANANSTYAQLQNRRTQLDQAKRPGQEAEDSARAFNEQVRAKQQEQEKAKNDDQPTPRGGAAEKNPPQPGENRRAPDAPPAPLKVDTLANDKSKSGLNEVMTRAETQLREGKYASAFETYEAAEHVAPNNPLIKLGKAHAELGGAYYRRAEVNLRQTLLGDRNLLAGQYDLRAFLGDDRLQAIERDLRDLIQKNDREVGPAVLLAYVYYNTANERRAAALLDLADKRAGGTDPLVTALKQNWALPTEGQDNK
ncbi:MAG TPA: hypothetical protein VGB55_05675 [Tepidisphaeraceae bacterium]|jgi:hypothetical protein